MRASVLSVMLVLPVAAWADEPRSQPVDAKTVIDRGLNFLVKDALAWKEKHNCVSCHHAGLVIWSMREAKLFGHTVNEPVLAELTKWVAESGNGKTGLPRPEGIPKALNAKAVWFALALAADPQPDAVSQQGLKLLWETVKSDQTENGSWASWPDTRPPIFGNSDESMTVLATLAILPAAAGGDESAKSVRDKAIKWLAETPTDDDPQSIAMRLVLWRKLGHPAEEWQPLVGRIKDRQNADGGWSQAKDLASDAWATGQALYALAHAGIKTNDPTVARARAFLVKTQREDGSWPMTSRPTKPGGEGSTSLIPITGAGAAWAVLGLVRSSVRAGDGAEVGPQPAVKTSDKKSLEPTLGQKGRLLLAETFNGDTLPEGWTVKSGQLRVAEGILRGSQQGSERLCLFNCVQPLQDAAIQIDFKFDGARGINLSVNPSAGELRKRGHLFSVMITPRMWNITEHNDKSDRASQSQVLVSATENFEPGKWYTILLETKGDNVVAQIEGKPPLRAASPDFRVKKPGIEFRVSGRNGEIGFDNLQVWELATPETN